MSRVLPSEDEGEETFAQVILVRYQFSQNEIIIDYNFYKTLTLNNEQIKYYTEMKEIKSFSTKSLRKSIALNQDFKKVFIKEIHNQQLSAIIQTKMHYYRQLDHPNLLKLIEIILSENLIIVTEYLDQANYFQNKILSQMNPIRNMLKLKTYIFDIAEALNYLHQKGFVHCDLRVEKLYSYTCDGIRTIKIGGLESLMKLNDAISIEQFDQIKPNHQLLAPEFHSGRPVDSKIDIWNFGVILYQFCMGYCPTILMGQFFLKLQQMIRQKKENIKFRKQDWKNKDKNLLQLIQSMLKENPSERPSALDILNSQFLQ